MTISFAEKKNVLLLAGAQALFQTASVLILTSSGVIGMRLTTDKSLATLPIALTVMGTLLAMIPASMLMQRYGRKLGFFVGIMSGSIAGLLGAYAIGIGSFWLFAFANLFVGVYQAFAQYYRFAAAEVASPEFKSRAISWTIAGGVIAALAGPNLARATQSLGDAPFLFSYLAMVALAITAACVVSAINIQKPVQVAQQGPQRTLLEIAKQQTFITALASSTVGYMVMLGVMTATPIAMEICGLGFGAAASVIQWHVLGMFVPSFFTGSLIQRFGVHQIMLTGIALLLGHVMISIAGIEYLHFLSALILLGIGWNFLFIGGTTLLTQTYQPSERAKTQAMHDFIVFGAVSAASFSSGSLLNSVGWKTLNIMVIPLLLISLAAIVYNARRLRSSVQQST